MNEEQDVPGAEEIEFDVRLTKEQQLIVSHDDTMDRISDITGKLCGHTLLTNRMDLAAAWRK